MADLLTSLLQTRTANQTAPCSHPFPIQQGNYLVHFSGVAACVAPNPLQAMPVVRPPQCQYVHMVLDNVQNMVRIEHQLVLNS
jgi:hypothetical protein